MKKILFPFILIALLCVGCKDNDSSPADDDSVKYENEWQLESGDVIYFSEYDIDYISDVTVLEGVESAPEGMESYVEDIFEYTITTSGYLSNTLTFEAEITLADNDERWSLCVVEGDDDMWSEVYGVEYDQKSGTITAQITTDEVADNSVTLRLALVKVGELIGDVELIHNPSGRNTLCAMISLSTAFDVAPQMTIVGQDNNDIVKDFELGTEHEIGVLGLYNHHTNQIFVDCALSSWGITLRKEFRVAVSDTYLDMYDISVVTHSENLSNTPSDLYTHSGIATNTAYDSNGMRVMDIGFDEYGKIRWLYRDTYAGTIRSYPTEYNGVKARFTTNCNNSIGSDTPEIKIYDYYGNTLIAQNVYGLQNLHHDALLIDNEIIVVPETKISNDSDDESIILEINIKTGEIVSRVDLDDVIDDDRPIQITGTGSKGEDRVHINSIAHSVEDDCLVVSMRKQGVVKIKRGASSSADIKWWMTAHNDVSPEWEGYLLTPTNFENVPENWNVGQHSAYLLENGDIMMFDNHNQPQGSGDTYREVSRVLTMRVDESAMSVEMVYEWETPDSKYCNIMSNVLMHPSTSSFVSGWATEMCVYETSYPDGEVLFYATINDFDTNIYRFNKVDIY